VSSRDDIAALVFAYAERLDAGDFDAVGELFADATYGPHGGPALRGKEAVRKVLRHLVILHDGTPGTKHVTSNLVVDVDEEGDTATARAYFTVFQATEKLPLQTIVAGRYEDRFARVGAKWGFRERVIYMDLQGDLSQHLRR
jgi:3-phenylpropionate/cinnamic acid dioxygenase small subunit